MLGQRYEHNVTLPSKTKPLIQILLAPGATLEAPQTASCVSLPRSFSSCGALPQSGRQEVPEVPGS